MLYRPAEITNLDTALKVLTPTYTTVNGVRKKTYEASPYNNAPRFFAAFKSKGGTESDVNGVYAILDTAEVTTWFRADIKSDSRIVRLPGGEVYEVIGEPENVDNRSQFLKFKVKRVKGEV